MRHAILFLALLSAMAVRAADYKSLVFQTSDGTTAVDLSSLVLTVADGKLVAANASGTQTFDLATLSKMYFSTEEATGVKSVTTDGKASPLLVYDLSGRKVGSYTSLEAAKSVLRQGVYVVRQNDKTFKIAVK